MLQVTHPTGTLLGPPPEPMAQWCFFCINVLDSNPLHFGFHLRYTKSRTTPAPISCYICHFLYPFSILHPQLMQQDPNQTAEKSDSCNCRRLLCGFIGDFSWKGWQASPTATCRALVAQWNGSINSISWLNLDPEWGLCVGSQSGLVWKENAFNPPTDKQVIAGFLAFRLRPESRMREKLLKLL